MYWNKSYYKSYCLIGLRMSPPGPSAVRNHPSGPSRARPVRPQPPDRSARSRPLASARLAQVAPRTIGIDSITNCFNLFQSV